MANLKEIRNRISSVKSTRQITSAMKMVSAAKLRKAQDVITKLRPYAGKLNEILTSVSASVSLADNPYAEGYTGINRVLIVVLTSNKGLCGGFNANVIKKSIELARVDYAEQFAQENVDFLVIGKKAYEYLKNKQYRIVEEQNELWNELDFNRSVRLAENLMKRFVDKEYDRIDLVYNQFKNAGVQILTTEQFLPIPLYKNDEESDEGYETDYIYEPNKSTILSTIIPTSLRIQIYKALLDSNASEHGARMTAMHQATENASDMIRNLTLQYNKARQAAITTEILEIVSGAEALKKK